MALTLATLIDDAEQAIGGVHDARIDPIQVVNEAGQYLFGCWSWQWRVRHPALLDFVADTAYVALPSDFGFGEVVSITAADTVTRTVELTTLEEIEFYRSRTTVASTSHYWVALAYPTQASVTASPGAARLEIYPTPADSEDDALRLNYRAGWVTLSAVTSVANVPVAFEHLLRRIVRAYSWVYAKNDYSKIEEVETSAELMRLKRMDGAAQVNYGPIRGGILRGGRGLDPNWNFSTSGVN